MDSLRQAMLDVLRANAAPWEHAAAGVASRAAYVAGRGPWGQQTPEDLAFLDRWFPSRVLNYDRFFSAAPERTRGTKANAGWDAGWYSRNDDPMWPGTAQWNYELGREREGQRIDDYLYPLEHRAMVEAGVPMANWTMREAKGALGPGTDLPWSAPVSVEQYNAEHAVRKAYDNERVRRWLQSLQRMNVDPGNREALRWGPGDEFRAPVYRALPGLPYGTDLPSLA